MVVRSVSLSLRLLHRCPLHLHSHQGGDQVRSAESPDEAALVVPSLSPSLSLHLLHCCPPLATNRAEIKYEAESPDEAALVVAAKALGFFFFKRTNTGITVSGGAASLKGEALQCSHTRLCSLF